ncbi:uncharacterized protein LOC130657226 [Hydractinia symbiolongicarpus]|uniref:uncharacterized protein LOC130657226 n=1 Tax=Hydractinia symbiolongicarpus TaxID=13093 RepID=UPI00254D668B|nr:uncharacterized protein LOC130657226 [Hydractinia symbiolongicarpus]
MGIGLFIFFSVLGVLLVALVFVNLIAKKYLNSDFTKAKKQDDEEIDQPFLEYEEEISETPREAILKKYGYQKNEDGVGVGTERRVATEGKVGMLLKQAHAYKQYTEETALDIMAEDQEDFAQHATLKLSLEYVASTSCIVGVIRSLNGLNILDKTTPPSINFHIKLKPSNRFRIKTKWKPLASSHALTLTFTMAPVSTHELKEEKLNIRLYGKSGLLSRPKCHGECFVKLDELEGKNKPMEFAKQILPKATPVIQGDGFSGSETE